MVQTESGERGGGVLLDNDMASYFLGVCQDFKHFGFAVSVIILNEQGNKVVRVLRKEACYVRFASANKEGVIPQVLYANWRNSVRAEQVEVIPLLNPQSPWTDLQAQVKKGKRKFAVVSRVPTPDSTYYPFLIMPRSSRASGTTLSNSSGWRRKRS